MAGPAIALFVSAVAGHHVTRFGSSTLIGAEVDLEHPGNIRWDEKKVVAIPEAEYQAYRVEYDRLIADGALVRRDAKDYEVYLSARDKALDEANAKRLADDAAAKKKVEADAKAAAAKSKPSGAPGQEI
jgi:hypothetical protein